MKPYKNVGDHVEDLADGRTLAPGETVALSPEAERDNASKIEAGVLLEAATRKSPAQTGRKED